MKDYRKMSRAELLAWIQRLRSKHATRTRTQRRQAATDLRDSAERLRAILETAVEGIITIDERGIIESFNLAAERIFGYPAKEVIGRNVSLLMPSPHREQHDTYLDNYLRTGHAKIIGIGREIVARRKNGTVFPMDLSVSEVRLADRRLFTGFIRDITERKHLEKEILEISEREQRRIGQDLHDGLCQHLAGIELMSQVLEQKLARRSKAAAARAGDIAKNVRDAIRHTRLLARGLSPVTLESEGLMSALQELALNTEKIFRVACRFDCDPPVLVSDFPAATHLFRLAQEAVSNAIKHGKAKRILIRLRQERGRLALSIIDNGSGFPPRISKSKGMGLRIMRSRAGMIGGTLAIERNAVGGTSVTVAAPNGTVRQKTNNHHAREK
ncbi:MAG TPA: PAS domain S-box protein [Verrucomicrobiae bacterium]|nr:PAS domain S-box protein [Verrucomicrobiae bacterium]